MINGGGFFRISGLVCTWGGSFQIMSLLWLWETEKFIIIYLRHPERETQWGDIIQRHSQHWFYRKLIFLQRKNKRSSSTTSSPSKIHFCVFFIFTINYFWSWGSIKKFITNKDKFTAEKILGVGREKSRLDNCTWTWIKIRSNVFTNFNCREGR